MTLLSQHSRDILERRSHSQFPPLPDVFGGEDELPPLPPEFGPLAVPTGTTEKPPKAGPLEKSVFLPAKAGEREGTQLYQRRAAPKPTLGERLAPKEGTFSLGAGRFAREVGQTALGNVGRILSPLGSALEPVTRLADALAEGLGTPTREGLTPGETLMEALFLGKPIGTPAIGGVQALRRELGTAGRAATQAVEKAAPAVRRLATEEAGAVRLTRTETVNLADLRKRLSMPGGLNDRDYALLQRLEARQATPATPLKTMTWSELRKVPHITDPNGQDMVWGKLKDAQLAQRQFRNQAGGKATEVVRITDSSKPTWALVRPSPSAPSIKTPAVREPWQMTQVEYVESAKQWRAENMPRLQGKALDTELAGVSKAHGQIIRQALAEDKPVPPEVLVDYPALRPGGQQAIVHTVKPAKAKLGQNEMPITKPVASEALSPAAKAAQATEVGISKAPVGARRTPQQVSEASTAVTEPVVAPTGAKAAAVQQPSTAAAAPPGKPPVKPPVTTGDVPPSGTAGVPKGSTPAVKSALSQAKAIVDRDAPGLATRVLDYVPGTKQVQRGLHPSLGMGRKVLEPYVAEGNVLGTVGTRLSEVRVPVVNRLKETFGEAVVKGTEKAKIRFLGTPAQAKYPATNTLYDIAQNPHLYDLTPVQRAAIEESEEALGRIFETVRGEYALDIGKFQNRPGSIFLSNVEKPEAGTGIFETAVRTAKSSRAKTRFYDTGRERWEHDVARGLDKPYDPVVDVEHLIGAEMHGGLSRMAGRAVYKEGLGGLDRMGALKATGHEALVKKMVGLRTRLQNLQAAKGRLNAKQQEAIGDFLSSPLEDADLAALYQGLEPEIVRGRNVGMGLDDIGKEIAGVRAQISALQPAWKTANTKGYQFVQEGIYKYFPDADAAQIRRLAEVSNNPLLRWVDDLRATAFGGDLSPVSIQMTVAWLSDPVGVSAALAKRGARGGMFTEQGMLASLKADPAGWSRFTRGTGINPLGGVDKEFSVGLIGKAPGVGKFWTEFNETVYRPVMRLTKDIFDNSYQAGLKHGLSEEQAIAVAADDAMKIIPRISARRLGMSPAEASRYRAVLTSVSFLTQPTALMTDATKAFLKMGLKQPISQSERFAVQRVLKIIVVTEAIAVGTAVEYARRKGQDPMQAARDALNPTHPNFMALTLPWGAKVGLGGPFRSLIRAVVPREVPGIPVPVPFAGIYRFGMSKMGPALRALYEVAPGVNRDYRGRTIRKHDSVPLDILRSIEHVVSGVAPLTAGTTYRTLRQGEGLGAAGEEALSQFAGTNYIPFDAVYNAKVRWDKDLDEYRDIPSNPLEVKARRYETPGKIMKTREEYRKANPEVDAKLFITGQVDSLLSLRAKQAAIRLMREKGIRVADIKGLEVKPYESKDKAILRRYLQLSLGEGITQPTPVPVGATP